MTALDWRKLAARVAYAFDVPVMDLLHAHRGRREVWPARFALCHMLRSRRSLSLPQIGRLLHRDHSTILHGIRRCEELLACDHDFAARYREARG